MKLFQFINQSGDAETALLRKYNTHSQKREGYHCRVQSKAVEPTFCARSWRQSIPNLPQFLQNEHRSGYPQNQQLGNKWHQHSGGPISLPKCVNTLSFGVQRQTQALDFGVGQGMDREHRLKRYITANKAQQRVTTWFFKMSERNWKRAFAWEGLYNGNVPKSGFKVIKVVHVSLSL